MTKRLLLALMLVLIAGASWAQPSGYTGMKFPPNEATCTDFIPDPYDRAECFPTTRPRVSRERSFSVVGEDTYVTSTAFDADYFKVTSRSGLYPWALGKLIRVGDVSSLDGQTSGVLEGLEVLAADKTTGTAPYHSIWAINGMAAVLGTSIVSNTRTAFGVRGHMTVGAGITVSDVSGLAGQLNLSSNTVVVTNFAASANLIGAYNANYVSTDINKIYKLRTERIGRNYLFQVDDVGLYAAEVVGDKGLLAGGKNGQLQLSDVGSRPTCDAAHRGSFWYEAGGVGVADTTEVCRKDAADAYAWVSIY